MPKTEAQKRANAKWRMNNPNYDKQYYQKNKDKKIKQAKDYYKNNKEYCLERNKQYAEANPEQMNQYKYDYHTRKRKWIQDYKLRHGCAICGYNKNARALEFHHIDGEKEFCINTACGKGLDAIKEEIKKCIVVCANCHREIHSEEVLDYA